MTITGHSSNNLNNHTSKQVIQLTMKEAVVIIFVSCYNKTKFIEY